MRWKRALGTLIESCVYMDPYAHMYYVTTRRARGEQASLTQDETGERRILHPIERLDSRREAQA